MGTQTTTNLALTDEWVQIANDKTILIIQSAHLFAELHIGASAPAASASGFRIPQSEPHMFPALGDFGGSAWVRGSGVVWYATN